MELIAVSQLVPSPVSRARGAQASEKIREYLERETCVDIDLRNATMVSVSFLDEIVLRLREFQLLDNITFVLTSEDTYRQLTQISSLRDSKIYFRHGITGERQPVKVSEPFQLQIVDRRRPIIHHGE